MSSSIGCGSSADEESEEEEEDDDEEDMDLATIESSQPSGGQW